MVNHRSTACRAATDFSKRGSLSEFGADLIPDYKEASTPTDTTIDLWRISAWSWPRQSGPGKRPRPLRRSSSAISDGFFDGDSFEDVADLGALGVVVVHPGHFKPGGATSSSMGRLR